MNKSLSMQIKKAVGYRILFCFFLAIIAISIFTLKEIANSSSQLENNIEKQCESLENFIVSQVLVKNEAAIQPKLEALNQKNNSINFLWKENNNQYTERKMHWRFPFSWTYEYPVKNVDESKLGTLFVTGPLLNDHGIFSDLLITLSSLLIFFLIIFIALYPLSKKIPERLFINPINNLLSLLRKEQDNIKVENKLVLPQELDEIHSKISDLLNEAKTRSHEAALGQIATQVAHDIRSPLLVLKTILSNLSTLPERQRIDARSAIQRVTDIANNLLSQYRQDDKQSSNTLSSEPVAILLESIVSEKRIQVANTDIVINLQYPANIYDAFIYIDIVGFKRILSNLLNNAIEAVKETVGLITIELNRNDGKIILDIKDNGCGMSQEKLVSLLKEGGTFGKQEGSGLGLPYAVSKITEWQGDYSLTSKQGEGTQFEIILPESEPAYWFKSKIDIIENSTIIVLDDDEYIHQVWNERFPERLLSENNLQLLHFKNPNDLILFCKNHSIDNTTFLVDYELGHDYMTGLEVVKALNIGDRATLVTSRYEDDDVRDTCQILGMRIIPKFFSELIPIHIINSTEIVLIDNEKIITLIWKRSAESWGKKISTFNDPEDFMRIAHHYSKETTIYIDSSLDKSIKGEEFAKILYEKGYYNLILATGYPKSRFSHVTWVKDIIGKEPPWGDPPKISL